MPIAEDRSVMGDLCIITARGGSKRIPRKNIKSFCGKPIIAYSIDAALQSKLFEVVVVSTDDAEIASVAEAYGASVPFLRSAQNSDDHATTADVVREVLGEFDARGARFDRVFCVYPTAPFITAEKLRMASGLLDSGADSVMPVVRFSYPPQRGMVIEGGILRYADARFEKARSQDLAPIYHDAGQFYGCAVPAFGREDSLVCGECRAISVSELEVQDIDTPEDWEIAEMKYIRMAQHG